MEKNYKISCINSGCGLFSDLLHRIIPSIIYLYDNKINDYHVFWLNNLYQNDKENLFNHFFNNKNLLSYDKELNIKNCPYGIYFSHYTESDLLKKVSTILNEIKLFNTDYFKQIKPPFLPSEKVLGLQQRKTDHFNEVKLVNDDVLIQKIKTEFVNDYDKIFLITDDNNTLNKFKNNFKEKLVYNDCYRSSNNVAIHYTKTINNRIKLADEVMFDSYCLSLTNYKLICNSNVSTFSLIIDYDKQKYEYIDKNL